MCFFDYFLDRFSQFFIAPLFSPTCTEREILAVDSEHKKNIPNDSWRVFGLLRQLSSKRHPAHKFATGTVQTLQGTSSIADIRDILINFYESHYSADMMKLVIYSKESLPAMEKMVREKFSVIKSLGIREEKLPPAWVNIPLFDAEAFKRIVWVKPLMDLKTLSIIFFPSDYSVPYKSRVLAYLTQLFGYEGPGSLSSYFHSRNWITSLVAWSNSNISGSNELYIDLTLTSFGVENYLEIIKSVFAFVNLLKAQGPQRRFFDDVIIGLYEL